MNYNLEIYNDFGNTLEKIWDEFEKNSVNNCFQNFYWLKNWYSNLDNNKNIRIENILVRKDENLIMILPMCVNEYRGVKYLKWQGGDRADYMSGLFCNNFKIKKDEFFYLWNLIKSKISLFDIIYFERQPKFIDTVLNPFVDHLNTEKDFFSSSIILEKSYDEFSNKNLKKKFNDDTRRRINSLKKIGNVEFKIYDTADSEERKKITKEIIEQKIQRIKNLKLKNNFSEEAKRFYINFENEKFKNGQLQISSLELDGKSISFHWGVKYKQKFYHLMPTTPDTEYMRFSPGRILLQYLVKSSIDNGLKELDFTIGDEPYKKDWYNNVNILSCYIEKNNFKHFIKFLLLKSKVKSINFLKRFEIIKKMYRQLTRILR